MDFRPLIKRQDSPDSRVHPELTPEARERIHSISSFVDPRMIDRAFNALTEEVPESRIAEHADGPTSQKRHRNYIMNADTEMVFSYIEILLIVAKHSTGRRSAMPKYGKKYLKERAGKIQRTLIEEGILWEVRTDDSGNYIFDKVESERMKESDDELRRISLEMGEDWQDSLSEYNEAFRLYNEGKYSKDILEHLYNSIEETVKTICVDKHGWEDNREMNLSNYLDTMRDKGFFEANNIMESEISTLLDSMEKTFSKIGNDRHNRHNPDIDRYYCNLLIHQTSAFLYYMIKRQQQM